MSLNAYWVYGLRIDAEIVCPELPLHPHPVGDPDVTIRLLSPVPSVETRWSTAILRCGRGSFACSPGGRAIPGGGRESNHDRAC